MLIPLLDAPSRLATNSGLIGVIRLPLRAAMKRVTYTTETPENPSTRRHSAKKLTCCSMMRGAGVNCSRTPRQTSAPEIASSTAVSRNGMRNPKASASAPPISGPKATPLHWPIWMMLIA